MPKAEGDIETDVLRRFKESNVLLAEQLSELAANKMPPWLNE
jgi:hypothetical protein